MVPKFLVSTIMKVSNKREDRLQAKACDKDIFLEDTTDKSSILLIIVFVMEILAKILKCNQQTKTEPSRVPTLRFWVNTRWLRTAAKSKTPRTLKCPLR